MSAHPHRVTARKQVHEIHARFAATDCTVQTREGSVQAHAGDAIMTGIAGEHWRVSRARFADKYQPVPPTLLGEAGRYVSRPNRVLAVPMDRAFDVVLADGISRLHGEAGDWLVDYGDGSFGIVGKSIFKSTYEIVS